MDRLLLLMTTRTYRASAFLDAAARLAVPVVVGTDRTQALATANPGGHLTLDFLEPEKATETITAFARRHPIRAIVAADDDGVVLAAMASEALGLPHNPVAAVEAARNKYLMRQILKRSGLRSPNFELLPTDADPKEAATRTPYPCVLKPLFLSASRGVIRADNPESFVAAFGRVVSLLQQPDVATQGGELARKVLVESFIPGTEVAFEGLLVRGKLKRLAIFDKPDRLDGPFFEETLYVTPSRLPPEAQSAIGACTAEAVAALGLREGPVHAELRLNDAGAWIIEIAPRSIGGLCSRTLRFDEGVSLEELILRQAFGMEVESFEREKLAAGVMMIPIAAGGVLRKVSGKDEAEAVPGIEEVRLTIPIGRRVVPLPEGTRYLGFLFARASTPYQVEAALREAHARLRFTIAPE